MIDPDLVCTEQGVAFVVNGFVERAEMARRKREMRTVNLIRNHAIENEEGLLCLNRIELLLRPARSHAGQNAPRIVSGSFIFPRCTWEFSHGKF